MNMMYIQDLFSSIRVIMHLVVLVCEFVYNYVNQNNTI